MTPQSPAQPSEVLTLPTVAGLGPTNPVVAAGAAAPSSAPFALTTTQPTIAVGSQQATVLFSGLTGFVGLYQVNVQVPSGVTPNSATPLVIRIGGLTAPPNPIATR